MCRALKFILFASCAVFYGGLLQSVASAADDVSADEIEKLAEQGPLLVNNYIPVTMQILHHCIEMIQYEPVMGAPGTEASGKPTTTRRPTTTTTTTTSPPDTTSSSTAKPVDALMHPTSPHKPGYYGPEKPPPTPAPTTVETTTTSTTTTTTTTSTTTTTTESPRVDNKPSAGSLLWSDKPFAEWFLQNKRKEVQQNSLLNVEFLDHLPLKVLQDFNGEPYEPLALRPEDNANEFRRLYDDSYRGPVPPVVEEKATKKGGKKRVPPTKPYLHMLVLYDLLKREAKNSMYNFYVGYSEAILEEMYQMNFPSAKEQLQFALTQLLERKDITKSDVVSRTKQMIKDLDTKNSAITYALELVPPLVFGL
ncbi:coiled-coil domain-containing protein 80 [Anopheles coustani]|uniref:coiled-coil domain-containing protein 80 n=1 Tax=Anopheles coustani TaxID=139045 RepID=UPI00265A99D4|nr:coiled-coil domain-containing protein 80 [Anopheles coustani]